MPLLIFFHKLPLILDSSLSSFLIFLIIPPLDLIFLDKNGRGIMSRQK